MKTGAVVKFIDPIIEKIAVWIAPYGISVIACHDFTTAFFYV
jgi:hypothetical protein